MTQDQLSLLLALLLVGFMIWKRRGDVSSSEARRLVEAEGARLLDVRTPCEFAAGNLPGAINVPVSELEGRMGEVGERGVPVVVYCASGVRSARAAGMLNSAGFAKVVNLGAMGRW